jgi:hypothetical protein
MSAKDAKVTLNAVELRPGTSGFATHLALGDLGVLGALAAERESDPSTRDQNR